MILVHFNKISPIVNSTRLTSVHQNNMHQTTLAVYPEHNHNKYGIIKMLLPSL